MSKSSVPSQRCCSWEHQEADPLWEKRVIEGEVQPHFLPDVSRPAWKLEVLAANSGHRGTTSHLPPTMS